MNNNSVSANNSNTTADTIVTSVDVGISKLESQILSYGFRMTVGGALSLVVNTCIGVGIGRSRRLRSRFYVCLCFLAITRSFISFQYLLKGFYDLSVNIGLVSSIIPFIACQKVYFFITVGSFAEELLLLLLVVDRAVAIIRPMYYRNLTVRQAVLTCLGIETLAACVRWFPGYVDRDLLRLVKCISIYSGLPKFFEVEYQHLAVGTMILCLALYIALLIVTRWRIGHMKRYTTDSEPYQLFQRQLALLPILLSCAGCHVIMTLLSRLCLTIGSLLPSNTSRLYGYAAVSQAIDLFLGGVIMLCMKQELQRECLPTCIRNRVGNNAQSAHALKQDG